MHTHKVHTMYNVHVVCMCVCVCTCVWHVYVHSVYCFRGELLTLQSGNVVANAWMDKRIVMVLSTGCNPFITGYVQRKEKNGSRVEVECPEAVILYNKHMGGVDRGDQKRGYYQCRTKSRKFYKYIFYFLFDVAITNTYILLRQFSEYPVTNIKDFRIELAKQLIGDYCSRRRPGRGGGLLRPLPLRHFPIKVKSDTRHNWHKRGRCARCKATNRRVDSVWWCEECSVWLCHTGDSDTDCFLAWHANLHEE